MLRILVESWDCRSFLYPSREYSNFGHKYATQIRRHPGPIRCVLSESLALSAPFYIRSIGTIGGDKNLQGYRTFGILNIVCSRFFIIHLQFWLNIYLYDTNHIFNLLKRSHRASLWTFLTYFLKCLCFQGGIFATNVCLSSTLHTFSTPL